MKAPSRTSWTAAQVVLVGHPAAVVAAYQPEHHAALLPPLRRVHQLGLVGVTGRLICHQVRTRAKPDASSQPVLAVVVGEGAGVDLLYVEPRAAPTSRAWPTAHSKSTSEQPVGDVVGQVALDDVDEEHPAARPGRGRCPRPGSRRPGRAGRRSPASAGPARRPRPGRRPPTPRPSLGRAARGRAAGAVSRATSNAVGRVGGADRPSRRGGGASSGRTSSGVALEPAVLGDHALIVPYAGQSTDPSESFGRVSVKSVRSGVTAVRLGMPGGQLGADGVDLVLELGDADDRLGGAGLGLLQLRGVRRGPRPRRPRPGGPRR